MKYWEMSNVKRFLKALGVFRLKWIAKRRARKTGERQFIVKDRGRARIINAQQFKWLKQHGCFPITMTLDNLKKISIYYTK